MADDGYCQDCKRPTEVAYDHANGDAICVECGLVLESHMVDETAEWRTFTDDNRDNDPVRIGAPSNPFLQGQLLETTVVDVRKERRGSQVTNYIARAAVAVGNNKSYSSLVQAFSRIDDFCERLGVNKIVKDLACDLYVKVHPFIIETRRDNSVVAACVHIACQKENQSRTLREMRMVTGVQEKKIVMAKNSITKILNEKVQFMKKLGVGTEQTSDYLKRFAHNFGLNNRAIKAALEILKKSEEHDIRRSPTSIAAGIVYITCQLADIKYLPEIYR